MSTVDLDRIIDPPLRRVRWTAAEVQRLVEAGILDNARWELLHGELFDMAPQGDRHWDASTELATWLTRRLPYTLRLAMQGPLRLSPVQEPEPDMFVYPDEMRASQVRGPDTLLVIEVADSSLSKDRLIKAPIYAAHGVRLYWVIDPVGRTTWVHRLVADMIYGEPEAVPFDQPLAAPEIAEPLVVAALLDR